MAQFHEAFGGLASIADHYLGANVRIPWTLVFAATVLVLLKLKAHHASKRHLRSLTGQEPFEIRQDARVLKFVASAALSDQGRQMAHDCPYLIRNGRQRELVITKPNHVQEFYRDDTKGHTKPRNLNMGAYFGRILGDAVGVLYGERWKAIRKNFDPEFSFQKSRDAIPTFNKPVAEWLDGLSSSSHAEKGTTGSFTVDARAPCKFLTFKLLIIQLYDEVFSEAVYDEMLELNALHETILHDVILNKRLAHRLWNFFDRAAAERAEQFSRRWKALNLRLLNTALEKKLSCPLARIYASVIKREISKTEFLHTLDEILFANVDVSSAVLTTMLRQLAAHRSFQADLCTELQVNESADQNLYFAQPDSLLNRLVMESMRLSPAFAFSLPECTATAKNIGSLHVPAGTAVIIDAARLNSDPETWGPDAAAFNPARFARVSGVKSRYGFMRFGVGGASGRCLGRNFADVIFKLVAMEIVGRFELTVPEDEANGDVVFSPRKGRDAGDEEALLL